MAPPTVLDWVDVKGFRYSARKDAPLASDLDVPSFVASLSDNEKPVDLALLRSRKIFVVSAKSDEAMDKWNSFACLYAEAELDNKVFILNNGKWYEIASTFSDQVLSDFAAIPESDIVLPDYNHENEAAYNDAMPAALPNSVSMDRKMIPHGGGHSTIEFCDILTSDKRMIHVKRYGGSAQFSHLFSQGVVAGELFLQDSNFRQVLNAKLPDGYKLDDPAVRPQPGEYEIVFAIISKSNNPLNIPFFSKVALRNTRRRLLGYGYRVTKKKIGHAPS
jgi:uncharacterized protein (TIGR04141 family)